jgi:digeranylgeranylglycerophospholipid reductase
MTGMPPESVDVLVVGLGPAGAAAAEAACLAGAGVLAVDRKNEIGVPVRCAEYVPRLMTREVELPRGAVAQSVDEMVVLADTGGEERTLGRVRSPGFILNRELLEKALADRARCAGAVVLMSARAVPAADGAVAISCAEGARVVRPSVVISAEGPFPTFGPGVAVESCLPSVQFTCRLASAVSEMRVYFSRRYRLGYAWLFPKGELANVGVACAPAGGRAELMPLLDELTARLRDAGCLTDAPPVRRTAGWIPVWGPPQSAVAGGVLLAGDAGGFTEPVTGAGIWPAIATGRLAGECAARAALSGDRSILQEYDAAWRSFLGGALGRAAQARRVMESRWDDDDFVGLVRGFWPGLSLRTDSSAR